MIGCSDAAVDPAQLTRGEPGSLYVLRNVAAIVPPYESDRFHGAKAAIEYGVKGLQIEHLIVVGHAHCGGLQALASRGESGHDEFEHLWEWVMLADPAQEAVERSLAQAPPAVKRRALEQAAVVVSLRNLLSYPWIRERAKARRLALHGWYFDLERGELQVFERRQGRFVSAEEQVWPPCPHGDACPPGCTCERFVNLAQLLRPPARGRARRGSAA